MLQVKVCGIRGAEQANELSNHADLIGFIYFKRSPRYIDVAPRTTGSKRVGVFVNEPIEQVDHIVRRDALDYVQLHGAESPAYCSTLRTNVKVIKAFGVNSSFDFSELEKYIDVVDLFLFDTKCTNYGGSGIQFDWTVLSKYDLPKPFILSGGIDIDSAAQIRSITHPKLYGVDINSQFEIEPGNKNINAVKHFIHELKN